MSGSLGKFIRDAKGAFAMQFALMAVPLCVCTGLAIDGGRAFLARYELASALDAAALAAGSTLDENADLDAVARRFVEMNFKTQHDDPILLELAENENDGILTLTGSVRINTFFMPLVGQPYVEVHAESEVRRGGNNVEVALALDVTGSMSGSKITALKTAAKDLVNEVVNDVQTPYFSKIAVVPWGTNVHVGSYAAALRGPVQGPVNISAAHWRDGASKTIAANSGWRVGGVGRAISAATWRNGSSFNVSAITKTNSNARIRVTLSANPSYANGDTIYITGITNGGYTSLNNRAFKVADRTTSSPYYVWLQTVNTTTYVAPPSSSAADSSTGASQRCFDTACDVRITTAAHTFAVGDRVRITGVSGMTQLNNAPEDSWIVKTAPSTTTFTVQGLDGPSTNTWTANGTASECYTADCKYVINATAHGFAANDRVTINGATFVSGSTGTVINTGYNATLAVGASPTTNAFYLPGRGYDYRDWSSAGTVAECFQTDCKVRVTTAAAHNLANNDLVQITSVGGATGINNSGVNVWTVASVLTGTQFTLASTDASLANTSSAYTSNTGTIQCVVQGCLRYRYLTAAGSYAIDAISNCVTERVGTSAHTDDAPATSYIGRDYPGGDGLVACNTSNMITPLTSDRSALTTAIDNMSINGSTAGQIGAEWGWYMVSPNWASQWPDDINRPKAYGTSELVKVVVLMTDGEFNTAHCNGVTAENYAVGSVPTNDRIDTSVCTPAAAPFTLAQNTCTAMKQKGVVIYTVGFQLNTALEGDEFLAACATSTSHAYLASTNEELRENFKEIATSITKLRLSK